MLALAMTACSGSGGPGSPCEDPAPQISNLTVTPVSAVVVEGTRSVDVELRFDFSAPGQQATAVNAIVLDSTGGTAFEVWDTGILIAEASYSLEVPVPAETADVFTISVFVIDLCDKQSNTLQVTFEVAPAVVARSDARAMSGVIHGSLSFDVTQIDFSTVAFGAGNDLIALDATFADVDGDGLVDCAFELELGAHDGRCCESGAVLAGKTYSGASFAVPINSE